MTLCHLKTPSKGNVDSGHILNPTELKARFISLFDASGWNQSELARRLGLTRGGVNKIVSGTGFPSESTVRHLELILSAGPAPLVGREAHDRPRYPAWCEQLITELESRSPEVRAQAVAACLGVVAAFPARQVSYRPERPRKVSSAKEPPLSSEGLGWVAKLGSVAAGLSPSPSSPPTGSTASTSERKAEPVVGSRRPSSPGSPPPAPAPAARGNRGSVAAGPPGSFSGSLRPKTAPAGQTSAGDQ